MHIETEVLWNLKLCEISVIKVLHEELVTFYKITRRYVAEAFLLYIQVIYQYFMKTSS
jgi:hypothetical protein